jgi:hypothetical protein
MPYHVKGGVLADPIPGEGRTPTECRQSPCSLLIASNFSSKRGKVALVNICGAATIKLESVHDLLLANSCWMGAAWDLTVRCSVNDRAPLALPPPAAPSLLDKDYPVD